VIELFHDGNLFANKIESVVLLSVPRTISTASEGTAKPESVDGSVGPLFKDVGLYALA
jgi:hypothetical protein